MGILPSVVPAERSGANNGRLFKVDPSSSSPSPTCGGGGGGTVADVEEVTNRLGLATLRFETFVTLAIATLGRAAAEGEREEGAEEAGSDFSRAA